MTKKRKDTIISTHRDGSATIRFGNGKCVHCDHYESLHGVAAMVGKTCIGCDTCPGYEVKPRIPSIKEIL